MGAGRAEPPHSTRLPLLVQGGPVGASPLARPLGVSPLQASLACRRARGAGALAKPHLHGGGLRGRRPQAWEEICFRLAVNMSVPSSAQQPASRNTGRSVQQNLLCLPPS